jgi:hypothetical protein
VLAKARVRGNGNAVAGTGDRVSGSRYQHYTKTLAQIKVSPVIVLVRVECSNIEPHSSTVISSSHTQFMRLVTSFFLATAVYAGSISGTVYLRQGQSMRPAPRVEVLARAADDSHILLFAVTDTQGRYLLPAITGRVSLSASKPGFFPRAIQGGDRDLIFDVAQEQLSGADFELLPGGVITGRITDSQGTPLDGVLILLSRTQHNGPPIMARTDDRGIYRAFGLEPARYLLFARPAQWIDKARPAGVYYRDASDASRAEPIEVGAASEIPGIDIVVRPPTLFQINGKIMLLNPADAPRVRVLATAVTRSADSGMSTSVPLDAGGAFHFSDLPAGQYILTATVDPGGRTLARRAIDLTADVQGMVLQPAQPARLTGQIVFTSTENPRPDEIRLRVGDSRGMQELDLAARSPEYRFDSGEILPGSYTLEVDSSSPVYVKNIVQESRSSGREISVIDGSNSSVRVEVGLDVAQISGVVKAADGEPLPHAHIALTKPSVELGAQADQRGRFVFAGLEPGEYRISASPRVDTVVSGEAAKTLKAAPGARMEIELTAGSAK